MKRVAFGLAWICVLTIVPACGYSVAVSTPKPAATAVIQTARDAEFSTFIQQYVAVRTKDRDSRRAVKIGTGDSAFSVYYFAMAAISSSTERQLTQLPRTTETRAYIEAALEAHQLKQQAESALTRAVSTSSSTLAAHATDLTNRSERAWRALEDNIEDDLQSRGLAWAAFGGRPAQ